MHIARVAGLFYNQPLMITEAAADAVGAFLWSRITQGGADDLAALDRPLATMVKSSSSKPYHVDQGIAMVQVNGELVNRGGYVGASSGVTSYEGIAAQLQGAEADSNVSGIMMEINSPGGQVAGLEALMMEMAKLKKPVWAIANSNIASAAYRLATGAQRIAVIPGGMAGSIGAVIVMRDLTKAMEKQGVSATIIRSGSRKMRGNGVEAMDDDTIARAQMLVDEASNEFISAVAAKRGLSDKKVRALEGEMLTANEAKAAGLIDAIATVSDFHSAMVKAVRKPNASASRGNTNAFASITSKGKSPMDDITMSQADYDAAITKASASGLAAGVAKGTADERTRIKAVLDSPAAATRPKLAATLAFSGDISATTAETILNSAAEEKPAAVAAAAITGAPANLLAAAMKGVDNPAVGASVDDPAANKAGDAKPDPQAVVKDQVGGLMAAAGQAMPKPA